MSDYNNLYKQNSPQIPHDNSYSLDKSWSDMWAKTHMAQNSNILKLMKDQIHEGFGFNNNRSNKPTPDIAATTAAAAAPPPAPAPDAAPTSINKITTGEGLSAAIKKITTSSLDTDTINNYNKYICPIIDYLINNQASVTTDSINPIVTYILNGITTLESNITLLYIPTNQLRIELPYKLNKNSIQITLVNLLYLIDYNYIESILNICNIIKIDSTNFPESSNYPVIIQNIIHPIIGVGTKNSRDTNYNNLFSIIFEIIKQDKRNNYSIVLNNILLLILNSNAYTDTDKFAIIKTILKIILANLEHNYASSLNTISRYLQVNSDRINNTDYIETTDLLVAIFNIDTRNDYDCALISMWLLSDEKQLKVNAEKMNADKKQMDADKRTIQSNHEAINYWSSLARSEQTQIYNSLNAQNLSLESTIHHINSLYSADDQKSQYQSMQTESINTAIYVFYFIYFALLIVVAFILVFNFSTMSLYFRGAIMAAFIAYPFTIGYIEMFVYISGAYMYSILNGNVYTNGQW